MFSVTVTDGKEIGLISGIISIFSTYNTGGAWSVFSNHTVILTIVSAIFLSIIMLFYFLYKDKKPLFTVSCALIVSGALGNLIDRIFLGYVRDFIKLDFINFPIFNFADMCICVGVILLCVYFLFIDSKHGAKNGN